MIARITVSKKRVGDVEWHDGVLSYSNDYVKALFESALGRVASPLVVRTGSWNADGSHDDIDRMVFRSDPEWFRRAMRIVDNATELQNLSVVMD